jgi:hypothetical protein
VYAPRKVEGVQYAGLALELKRDGVSIFCKTGSRKGKLVADLHIQEQYYLLQHLGKLGYYADFGVGFDSCKKMIDWYLNSNGTRLQNIRMFEKDSSKEPVF